MEVGDEMAVRADELAQISHLLARWHMPDHLKTRRSGGVWLQWLATAIPACWLVLLWACQMRSGARRQVRARRGVRFLHPLVQRALAGSRTGGSQMRAAVQEFLLRQFVLVSSAPAQEACLYLLGSRSDVYVGITATARKGRQACMSGASWRYWEHLVEIFRPARDPAHRPSQKVSCFRHCRMGHVGMLVVALSTRWGRVGHGGRCYRHGRVPRQHRGHPWLWPDAQEAWPEARACPRTPAAAAQARAG